MRFRRRTKCRNLRVRSGSTSTVMTSGSPRDANSALICPSRTFLPRGLRNRGGTNGVTLVQIRQPWMGPNNRSPL